MTRRQPRWQINGHTLEVIQEHGDMQWRRAAKINVQWGQRARRHLRLWDTLLDLWTLRGRR